MRYYFATQVILHRIGSGVKKKFAAVVTVLRYDTDIPGRCRIVVDKASEGIENELLQYVHYRSNIETLEEFAHVRPESIHLRTGEKKPCTT
ncbi:MAG: hypothetical protein ACLFR8_07420 [Alkalispirochaeta sp.]